MLQSVPMMPFAYRDEKFLSKGLYPVASIVLWAFPSLERDLDEAESALEPRQYVAGGFLAAIFYFLAVLFAIAVVVGTGMAPFPDMRARALLLSNALLISLSIFGYILLYPKWLAGKRMLEMDKDLLFATRHLMIQASSGVPLFEAIVTLTEGSGEGLGEGKEYGEVGKEFSSIVARVRSGTELSVALEQSADASSSKSYRKVAWQLANANKTGARVGPILKEEVEYLASEQIIMMRSYGSQLGTLALFYMLGCIIAPTMGVVMLAIGASVLPSLPLNEQTFIAILAVLIMLQVFFVGLIKSRRPVVSL